ncbi:DUF5640 domain-containing protein [Ruminococcus sp.]|uniref:DUF5640 domain-containing protein n=1 Tax=Ruminococcus sp. TaxID=41978 RepID=UPI001AFD5502|nr:DUF5640 domain-containing protein [Ruminococcus sp.]MBO5557239.1 hypothetical protein [Ruminococcus sp.]
MFCSYQTDMTKKHKISILLLLLILVIGFMIVLITNRHSIDEFADVSVGEESSDIIGSDSIVGLWLYTDGTKYEFEADMTGGMYIDEYKYTYTYSVLDNELKIDYDNAEVHDSVYSYSFQDGKLKLVGGEGTAGGEYLLERE